MSGGAILSDCELYRHALWRDVELDEDMAAVFGAGRTALLIGVNPSTADAEENDATIRKDIGFARRLGWRKILKGNLADYRATDVRELGRVPCPISAVNDEHLQRMMLEADVVVPCWGPAQKLPKHLRQRWRDIVAMAGLLGKELLCFGTANDGQPRHTLMLAYSTPLVKWNPPQ